MKARTERCSFELDERGFVLATIDEGAEMELPDAVEAVATIGSFSPGRKLSVLVDLRGVLSQSRECRQHFVGEEAERTCEKVALLVSSPLSKVIANFFLRLTKQPMPTKLFTTEDDAVQWLLEELEP